MGGLADYERVTVETHPNQAPVDQGARVLVVWRPENSVLFAR